MKPPRLPAGRGPYERVSVLRPEGCGRLVLGRSEPDTDDRRARAAAQWGTGAASPRKQAQATIDLPLPPRVQTALSYRIDPALARQLTGGPSPPPTSRREATEPVQAVIVIGQVPGPASGGEAD
jgi:hypothetical protein